MRISLFSSLFLMPLCSLFLGFCIYVVSDQCLGDQQSLLLQLKKSLQFDHPSSRKLVHWNPNDDCCFWAGVTCNEGRVIGLDLSSEWISGGRLDSSSSLFSLRYLEHLNLADNDFTGSEFPDRFLELKNLSYLNLSGVGFRGQIPIGISQLTKLVTLDLSDPLGISSANPLKIESPDLATLFQNLSALKELYLDGVDISAGGYEWCRALSSSLPNLSVLSMSRCKLSGPLDSSLLNLQSLSFIHLGGNNFSAPLPEFFADFQNLTSLSLPECELKGEFPQKILLVPTLQIADLSGNDELQGSLSEFPLNGSLRTLVLSGTGFSGRLPHSIGYLKMLSRVDLSYCSFSGPIPSTLTSLTQLVYWAMRHNNFTGPIPSFNMAKNLTEIHLAGNRLTGEITSNRWEELVNLKILDLNDNLLEGSIPSSLFSLPSLQYLFLGYNRFSGQVDEFFNISAFQFFQIDLSGNNLEGPIPMSLFDLPHLEYLSLSSNNFNGSFQLNLIFQLFRSLLILDLSANNLSIECSQTNFSLFSSVLPPITLRLAFSKLNSFPDCLRNQSNLLSLDLSNNHIQGEIPKWVWELPYLHYLNLSFNNLVNREQYLLNSSSLDVMDLRSNQLQGPLPAVTSNLLYMDLSRNNFSSIVPASISSNKLYGRIPGSICNATQLRFLDVSDNSISGSIPQCLIGMSETLYVLNLRRNNLTGTISDTFPSSCGLEVLALNGNQLEGELPKSLASCTILKILDIGNNCIEDSFPCYLEDMSWLGILILRFNKFYGPIGCPRKVQHELLSVYATQLLEKDNSGCHALLRDDNVLHLLLKEQSNWHKMLQATRRSVP
ncbi:Receptor-like protein 12 [Morella rubra]|uniref:Receptor-like protein 12 n=1 Tax=Morella rubra TaxID=262757 RepID=A0A6A1WTZ2_9ROSI|nr:Receptor-like protein 12 [Morella rubra]